MNRGINWKKEQKFEKDWWNCANTYGEEEKQLVYADTWEYKILDISAVANANKDVIDSIIVTIVNADADNTFYIDCVFSDTFINNLKQYRRVRVPGAITG